MLLYLDANCFNRPFDDQSQPRIHEETEAVLQILRRIVDGTDALVWSTALTVELNAHPEEEIRSQLLQWSAQSQTRLGTSKELRERVEELVESGLKVLDAAHVAFAEAGSCTAFLTCDDRIVRTARRLVLSVRVMNPVEYIAEVNHA